MTADIFRHFFAYHFSENRILWDRHIAALSQEQYTQDRPYSLGSVRNHVVHLVSVDDTWFSGLRGLPIPDPLDPAEFDDRDLLRARWDVVEESMRTYLAALQNDMLQDQPLEDEDDNLRVWQVLLHVVNHGTDHRSQVLRLLHDLGQKTVSQDYIFYVYDNPA